jgi:tetratricopeptide (TPR) repeat protein
VKARAATRGSQRRTAAAAAFALACWLAPLPAATQAAADLGAARAAVERRDFGAALPAYDALVAARPADADLLIEAARVYGFADRNAEAAALYRRALAAAPRRRHDIVPSLAWQLLWSGGPAEAAALFEELAELGPGNADAHDGLGQAYDALGRHDEAAAAFRKAIALKPGDARLKQRAAKSLLWADRPREAVAAYELAGAATDPAARAELARAYAWAGFEDRALPLLQHAAEADAVWLRDFRVARELAPYVFGSVEHTIDRDRLETLAFTLGGGRRLAGGPALEAQVRKISLRDANGAPDGAEAQLAAHWRIGTPDGAGGTLWPTLALRAARIDGWSPLTGAARVKWIPRDRLRVDAEVAREWITTPLALENRVTVDVASIGADLRPLPALTLAGALAALHFDDGNRRTRLHARAEYTLRANPRFGIGVEAMGFDSSRPTGPDVPARGYWNPERYREARLYAVYSIERRPWDFQARLGAGTSRETDGFGDTGTGHPNVWELAVGYDLSATLRARLAVGGSGSGLGLAGGGAGYWRRAASVSLVGWY